jgi:hypothetical protein
MSAVPATDYDSDRNSMGCHALAIKAARERCIRSGQIQPRVGDATEQRWAREGTVPNSQLEAVADG